MAIAQKHQTTCPSDKLDYHRLGPFKILDQRGKSSFLLKLPSSLSRLHLVFHTSILEPYIDPHTIPDRITTSTTSDIKLPDNTPNQISTIIDSRKVGRRYDYFIHWKDTADTENSWIPFSEIPNTLYYILEQFHRRNPSRPHPPRFQFSTTSTEPPASLDDIPSLPTHDHYQPTRTPSPPPQPCLRDYQPPLQQKSRYGRLIHPQNMRPPP